MTPLGPGRRALLTLIVVILAAGGVLVARALLALGVFTAITPGFSGRCVAVGGVSGPGDLAIDDKDGLVFLAARDGLYTLALDAAAPGRAPRRLAGTPADFHPIALSLYRGADGALTLMALDRRAGGRFSVEIFDVRIEGGAARLSPRSSIQGGLLIHPHGIAAASPQTFYVTNDTTVRNRAWRTIARYALLRQSDVIYFDGMSFRTVAKGLDYASGIALSRDGGHVYVASMLGRALYAYTREPFSGALTQAGSLAIPAGPDRIAIDAAGDLWVAGHPRFLALARYRRDRARPPASEIFKVTLRQGLPRQAVPVYANDGGEIAAASVGAVAGKSLLIGSALDDKILSCQRD